MAHERNSNGTLIDDWHFDTTRTSDNLNGGLSRIRCGTIILSIRHAIVGRDMLNIPLGRCLLWSVYGSLFFVGWFVCFRFLPSPLSSPRRGHDLVTIISLLRLGVRFVFLPLIFACNFLTLFGVFVSLFTPNLFAFSLFFSFLGVFSTLSV